ncbi:MAG: SDR family NAD(P)-dependent oxidoreductase [Pseudomonadota bacterium]
MSFDKETALVTGASRGLGFAVSRALAAAGAQVIALARTQGGLEELDDAIAEDGGTPPILVAMDIAKPVDGLTTALAGRIPHLDYWIHTAIYAPPLSPVEHMDPKDLSSSLKVNLTGTAELIKAIDPLLRRAPAGRAVFFEDPAANGGGVHGAYGAGKSGALVLARAWGETLRKTSPGRVVFATPPPMATGLRARFYPGEDSSQFTATSAVGTRLLEALRNDGTAENVIDLR